MFYVIHTLNLQKRNLFGNRQSAGENNRITACSGGTFVYIDGMNRIIAILILCGLVLAACSEDLTLEQRTSRLKRLTEQGEYDKAMEHLAILVKEKPTDQIVLMTAARLYFETGQYDTSLSYAKKFSSLYSEDVEGYRFLYTVSSQLNDYKQMLWALSQLGYKEKNREKYLPEIAQLNLMNGSPGLAVAVCRDIVKYDPDNPQVLFTLGSALMEINKGDSAILVMERVNILQPNQLEVLANLGMYYAAASRIQQAEEVFGQITVLYPEFIPGWFGLGNVLTAKGDTTGAIEAYRRVSSSDPTFLGVDTLLRNLGNF